MKNKYLMIILIALLALPAVQTKAANEVTFSADTTFAMTSPSTNITVLADSIADSITVNGSTIDVTLSSGGILQLRSMDKYILTENTSAIDFQTGCTDSYYYLTATARTSSSGELFTVLLTNNVCSNTSNTTVSSSPSTSSSSSSDTTSTETSETTDTAKTTNETSEATDKAKETSVKTIPGVPEKDAKGNVTLAQQAADAAAVATGDVSQVTAKMGVARDAAKEAEYSKSIVEKIVKGSGVTAAVRNTINNFVTYGTPATKVLGAGERGGVVNSYQAAFGKLPSTASEWNDVIKIANGRWPGQSNKEAENRAKVSFKTIYLREADMKKPNDNAAVTVMAYGLRPANRNLNSEKTAIKTFKAIFGYNPTSATNWDAVRAVAYSGATR